MLPVFRLAAIFATVVTFAGISGCENKIEDIKQFTDKKTSVEQGIQIQSFLSQAGKMKAKLTSPLMKRYTDSSYIEFPNRLHVDFYNDSTVVESELFAKYGRYKEGERKVFLRDSVVIFNSKGDTIHCQELWWDQQLEKYYTYKPVVIKQPDKTLYGEGLEASQNFNTWTLIKAHGPVKMPADAGLQ